jgi:hypothetical protein
VGERKHREHEAVRVLIYRDTGDADFVGASLAISRCLNHAEPSPDEAILRFALNRLVLLSRKITGEGFQISGPRMRV